MPESRASVRFVTAWGVTVGAAVLVLGVSACGGGSDAGSTTTTRPRPEATSSTSTVPERPTSTTTTMYDPAAVEGQVEAAYLASWEVYADAVYDLELDEQALAEVYADPLLSVRRHEIESRVAEGRAALVSVEHEYTIERTGDDTAAVIDTYVNHQVLIDRVTKKPIEDDPNETIVDAFTARRVNGVWLIFDQRRLG